MLTVPTVSNTTAVGESSLHTRAERLSRLVARNVFSISTLYPAHVAVLTHLAMTKFRNSPLKPLSVLFVHPTGGGKLLVRDVHSVLFRGMSLTVVPVLSLGEDLSMKVQQKALQGCGRVVSIHLDEVRNAAVAKQIIDSIESLSLDT